MVRIQFLLALGSCLLVDLFHYSGACSCFPYPIQPQTPICNADLVVKVKILDEAAEGGINGNLFYWCKINKVYRDVTGLNYKKNEFITIKTAANDGLCGISGIDVGEQWLFSASSEGNNQFRVGLCSYNVPWSNSVKDLVTQYSKNCICEPVLCEGCDKSCIKEPGCKLYLDINNFDYYCRSRCYAWYGICKPSKNCKKCQWSGGEDLDDCLAKCSPGIEPPCLAIKKNQKKPDKFD